MEKEEEYWFAMKVFYNKVFQIEEYFQSEGMECYIPVQWEEKVVAGEHRKIRKPIVSSLLFFRTTKQNVLVVEKDLYQRVMVYKNKHLGQPAVIPDQEMKIFKMVTSVTGSWDFVDVDLHKFSLNDRVKVTGGEFEGAEGYIKRIKGNRRLVVAIEGIVAIATTYIPSCYLQKVNDEIFG